MEDPATLLEQLRDVQHPPPPEGVSFILILANVFVAGMIITLLWYRWHRKTHGWRTRVIKALRKTSLKPPEEALGTIARLLRQLMLSRGQAVHSLSGKAWLQELDVQFQTHWFTEGQGQVFGDGLYQPATVDKLQLNSLCKELEVLIRSLPVKPSHAEHLNNHPVSVKIPDNKAVES